MSQITLSDFGRQFFTAAELQSVNKQWVSRSTDPLIKAALAKVSDLFVAKLYYILGRTNTQYFLNADLGKTIGIALSVIGDFEREDDMPKKDLQLTLFVNFICALVHKGTVARTKIDDAAENIIKQLELTSDIKLAIRQELFDKGTLASNVPWVVICRDLSFRP